MNYRLILAGIAVLACVSLSAQNKIEVGVNYAPYENFAYSDDIPNMLYKFGAYGESRWPLSKHFDFGARLDGKAGPIGYHQTGTKKYRTDAFSISGDLLALIEFHGFPEENVKPFFTFGVGPGFGMHNDTIDHLWSGRFFMYADAGAGLEFFQHLRVSVDYSVPLVSEMFTTLNINVGWVF